MTTGAEDLGQFVGIPPRARYVPALTHDGRWVVRDCDTDLIVPDSGQATEAEAWAMAGMLCESAARELENRPVLRKGRLDRAEFDKALKDLRRKLREASLTTKRAELRNILEELQHLAFEAKALVIDGGVWEPGE